MAGQIIYKEESYRILRACFEVYKEKGPGFVEPVYQECQEIELALQEIPFVAQSELELTYKGPRLKQTYKPEFVCFEKIILEIKAVSKLLDEHRAQVHNYLKAMGLKHDFWTESKDLCIFVYFVYFVVGSPYTVGRQSGAVQVGPFFYSPLLRFAVADEAGPE